MKPLTVQASPAFRHCLPLGYCVNLPAKRRCTLINYISGNPEQ